MYICEFCNKNFKLKHHLLNHLERKKPCIFNIKSNDLSNINNTIVKKDINNNKNILACEYCNKIFSRKDSKIRHYNNCNNKINNNPVISNDIIQNIELLLDKQK